MKASRQSVIGQTLSGRNLEAFPSTWPMRTRRPVHRLLENASRNPDSTNCSLYRNWMKETRMKNILCLSSGLMPQYRLDILRAIALPPHAIIQFRYSEQLVESGLRDAFSNNRCTGRRVLIGHVDGNASRFLPESVCPITLCREAFIQKSQRSGSYFVLRMALGSMVLSHDWQGAQAE